MSGQRETVGTCERCDRDELLTRHMGEWLCCGCVNGDDPPSMITEDNLEYFSDRDLVGMNLMSHEEARDRDRVVGEWWALADLGM